MIPSILSHRTERRCRWDALLGLIEEWRAVLDTSAGVPLHGAWRLYESVALMDLPALKSALAAPLAA